MALIKVNNRSSEDTAIHGRRNIFINSGFLVSQRGDYTSATAISSGARQITVDRWKVDFDGQPSTFQIADETVEGKTRRVAKQVITAAGGGNYFHVMQQIECEQWMVGQTFTISGWVKTNVSGQKIRVCDDAGCHLVGSAITADGTWQRIEVTHTLPTNEVVGNSFQVHPAFGNHLTASVGDYLHWSEFQMELGTKATPFEHRTYGEELNLCRRYFRRLGAHSGGTTDTYAGYGSGVCNATNVCLWTGELSPPMRAAPAITGSNQRMYDGSNNSVVSSFATNRSDTHHFWIEPTGATTNLVIGRSAVVGNNNNTTGYVDFDSEF